MYKKKSIGWDFAYLLMCLINIILKVACVTYVAEFFGYQISFWRAFAGIICVKTVLANVQHEVTFTQYIEDKLLIEIAYGLILAFTLFIALPFTMGVI